MSVLKYWNMKCPKCGDDSHLDIEATLWVRLTSDGTDADLADDHGHEWDGDSGIRCRSCDWMGVVKAAEAAGSQ